MATPYRQESRIAELKTPFGTDVLVLTRFDGTEGVSELFEYRIEALSDTDDLDFDEAIGKHCTLRMNAVGGGVRYFDGILVEAQWLGIREGGFAYRLILRPWLWVLSQRKDNFIFHEKSAPDIIQDVFGRHRGLANFERRLSKSYPTLEYCVQYNESDLAFVCRLMEDQGIAYMFLHQDGQHKLVMVDSATAYETIPGGSRPYFPLSGQYRRDEEHFFHWVPERRLTTGRVALNDYDFKKPSASLMAEKTGDASYENGKLESYHYPGKYTVQSEGNAYAQTRLEMVRAGDGRFLAAGDCVSCFPGSLVELKGHPTGAQNREYLTLRCTHSFLAEAYRSGGTGDSSETYEANFEFLKADQPYAPPMTMPKPYVVGPQTAEVVGPQGEEIHCDEYGRIRVRFHWDRENDQSMWCRVAQVWAGKNWGGIFIPRIGMEVIVEFLEGDPDKPIIVGCVYNAENKPPFPLPDEKEYNGWKSNSTKGGGGYNELVFYDKKGAEDIRVHAQKDVHTTVLNDEFRTVGKNETRKVGNDRKTNIGVNDTLDVGSVLSIAAGQKVSIKVGASSIVMDATSITIQSPTINVKAAQTFSSKAGMLSEHKAGALMDIKGSLVKINS